MGKRFSTFGVVINPETEKKIDWTQMSKEEISETLLTLQFATKRKLEEALIEITIEGQRKKGQTDTHTESDRYNVKIVDYGGQLEQGKGGTPHWQLWVETKPQTTKIQLLKALSEALYNKERSSAISIQEAGLTADNLKGYCTKEGRLELVGDYEANLLDKATRAYRDYLEENPQLKKYMKALGHIKDTFFNM